MREWGAFWPNDKRKECQTSITAEQQEIDTLLVLDTCTTYLGNPTMKLDLTLTLTLNNYILKSYIS